MLMTISIIVGVLVVALLAFAASKPDTFLVQRSIAVKASPETVYPLISDWHNFLTWSPFEKDPAMKRTFKGTASAKGAIYEWDGNNKVGAGRIEIIEATAPSKLVMQLDMIKPMKAQNIVEFTLAAKGGITDVTWAMKGRVPFLGKLMGLVMNCEKMVGSQFEEGLAKLKGVAEQPSQPVAAA
jgi:Polyketide cyclase / dehydrase and lipid transport